jgi:hypothetical protein
MFILIENDNCSLAPQYATIWEAMQAASEIAEFNLSWKTWKHQPKSLRAEHGLYSFVIKQLQ